MASSASYPVRICIPLEAACTMASYEAQGIPGDYDIPIPDPDGWMEVLLRIREGDQVALYAMAGDDLIEIPAIVVNLDPVRTCVQVVA